MNELATLNTEQALAPAFTPGSTGGDLIREAAALWGTAYQLARSICSTSIVPVHFRGKPEECAAAMVYGASLGLDPIASLRGLYNVHGSVAMYAQLAVSIVLRDQHDVWIVESTDQAVTVAGRRKGWPEDRAFTATWTYDRARRAGYTGNKKYDTDPIAMLTAKAQMEVCRRIAPDSLNGIYSVEELDLEPGIGKAAAAKPAVTAATFTSLTRQPEPAAEPDDATPAGVNPATGEVTDPEPPTRAALDAMFAAFTDAGFDSDARTAEGKKARLGYMSQVLNRHVDATKGLTVADVEAVTDALAADAAERGQS